MRMLLLSEVTEVMEALRLVERGRSPVAVVSRASDWLSGEGMGLARVLLAAVAAAAAVDAAGAALGAASAGRLQGGA